MSNAVPEAVDHSKHGAQIELREVANADDLRTDRHVDFACVLCTNIAKATRDHD